MIHVAGNSSGECKVLGGFGTKYAAAQPNKYHGNNPLTRKILQKKQENHATINNVVDEIQMTESKKLSAVNHKSPEFLEIDYDKNDMYQVENMSLDQTKEKIE